MPIKLAEPDGDRLRAMGCFVVLFALISPRLALFFLWLFSNILDRAYEDWWLPFLGFFLLPWTTLTYAVMYEIGGGFEVSGIEWFFVALAFALDLSAWFGGRSQRTARSSV